MYQVAERVEIFNMSEDYASGRHASLRKSGRSSVTMNSQGVATTSHELNMQSRHPLRKITTLSTYLGTHRYLNSMFLRHHK